MSISSRFTAFFLRFIKWCQQYYMEFRVPWRQKSRESLRRRGLQRGASREVILSSPRIPDLGAPDHPIPVLPSSNLEPLQRIYHHVGPTEATIVPKSLDSNEPITALASAFDSLKGATNPFPQTPLHQPVPVLPTSSGGDFSQPNFEPAKSSYLGCISGPEGKPSCEGGYSDVSRCQVQFFTPSEALPTEVAVKVLRAVALSDCPDKEAKMHQRFSQEVRTWRRLPDHPNIVPLIGWTQEPKLSLISPWYKQGDLRCHLKCLSDIRKLHVLIGIAKGLECLHSQTPPVVHGDLKPQNILLSDQGEPLLADFGLSTILGEEKMYTYSHRGGGSLPWMSPECIRGESRSCQSDIYSFGTLAFTVMTGQLPYAGLTDCQITLKVCDNSKPMDPIDDWNKYPELQGLTQDLLKDCWSPSPSARLSMPAIIRRLTTIIESRELESPGPS